MVAAGAAPSSAATDLNDRRGSYAGYTAEVNEPSMMVGILQVPNWGQCNVYRNKAITSTLGLLSSTGARALLEINATCSFEYGQVAVAYLRSGSASYQVPWQLFQREGIRLEVDVDAGIIRASNVERSQSDEHTLPASFAADRLVAYSTVTTPEVGHRFLPQRVTGVTVDGVSLARLDPTKHEQVYLREVIAYPTGIDHGGDFRIRASR
jgi:hypothetical protein